MQYLASLSFRYAEKAFRKCKAALTASSRSHSPYGFEISILKHPCASRVHLGRLNRAAGGHLMQHLVATAVGELAATSSASSRSNLPYGFEMSDIGKQLASAIL